jgi:hypothetical protein
MFSLSWLSSSGRIHPASFLEKRSTRQCTVHLGEKFEWMRSSGFKLIFSAAWAECQGSFLPIGILLHESGMISYPNDGWDSPDRCFRFAIVHAAPGQGGLDLRSEKRPPSQSTSRSSRRHFKVLMNASLIAPDAGHYCLPAWKHASAGFVTGTGAHWTAIFSRDRQESTESVKLLERRRWVGLNLPIISKMVAKAPWQMNIGIKMYSTPRSVRSSIQD